MNIQWTKHKNGYKIQRNANKNLKFGIGNMVAWGDVAACLFIAFDQKANASLISFLCPVSFELVYLCTAMQNFSRLL